MSFWTDAAVLGEAGIPSRPSSTPGGAGLSRTTEYVLAAGAVLTSRDPSIDLAGTLLSVKTLAVSDQHPHWMKRACIRIESQPEHFQRDNSQDTSSPGSPRMTGV